MSLNMITETMELMEKKHVHLDDEKKQYVFEYAFQSGSAELTEKLLDELSEGDADLDKVKAKYELANYKVPDWVEQIENLIVALELYQIEEEKAITKIAEFLQANGVSLDADSVRKTGTEELKEMVLDVKEQARIM